ncbi:MAG: efflux RND transporter periplasmic adaptor subunit [Deltaproteobacteria bacterium]
MRHPPLLLLAAVVACDAPSPATPAHRAPVESTQSRWVRAEVPNALALLEAPAHVVEEEIASGSVTVLFGARVEAVHVAPGDTVEAGQPIADVVMMELNRAAAALVGLDDQITLLGSRLTALEALEAEKLVRAEELYDLRSRRSALAAERAQARALLKSAGFGPSRAAAIARAGRATLRAPLAGVVAKIDAKLGGFASAGSVLAQIVGQKNVRVQATLTSPLPEGVAVELVLTSGERFPLAPKPVGSIVDPHTGQIRVWFALAEPRPLAAGLRGRIRADAGTRALVQVPSAAVVRHDDRTVVYVVEGDTPVPHAVEVATDSGTSALVSGPIKVGAMVVVDPVVEPAP